MNHRAVTWPSSSSSSSPLACRWSPPPPPGGGRCGRVCGPGWPRRGRGGGPAGPPPGGRAGDSAGQASGKYLWGLVVVLSSEIIKKMLYCCLKKHYPLSQNTTINLNNYHTWKYFLIKKITMTLLCGATEHCFICTSSGDS